LFCKVDRRVLTKAIWGSAELCMYVTGPVIFLKVEG
jgi:hypothetical protein